MRKADKNKLWIIVGISLLFFLAGCVDTGVQVIPSTIDYTSQVKIVNLAAGMGSANVTMKTKNGNTITFNAIAFGDESAVTTVPAGSKTLSVTYSGGGSDNNLPVVTETDYKMRLYLVGDANGRTLVKGVSRYIFQTSADTNIYKKGIAQISFFNGSPNYNLSAVAAVLGSDTTDLGIAALASGEGSRSFTELTPGNYTFILTSGDDGSTSTITANLSEKARYILVAYDNKSSLKTKILTDD